MNAAIVTWSITPLGSREALNDKEELPLSTHSRIQVAHDYSAGFTTTSGGTYTGPSSSNFITGTVNTYSQNRHLVVRGVGEISFLNARGKGADFAVNRSVAFSSGNLTISSFSSLFSYQRVA